jgi:hypothetical protein
MKNTFFWDVTLYGSCKNRRCGGTYGLHRQDELGRELAVTGNRSTLLGGTMRC